MDWTDAIELGSIPVTSERPAQCRPWPQSLGEFETLIDDLQHPLVQFAFCRLQSIEDAEDVVQEVFIQAYREREKRKNVENAGAFLFRMVANRSTDVLRKRRRTAGTLNEAAASVAAPVLVSDTGRQRWIEALLARLPSRQAEVIRLRVYGELPFEAIAQAVGCSLPTVKSRFRYGIEKLRRVLKRAGGER